MLNRVSILSVPAALVASSVLIFTTAGLAQDCGSLPAVFDCVRDRDCVHEPQFDKCGCMNGGLEFAINKKKRAEHRAWREACTGGGCFFFVNCRGYDGAYCSQGTCTMGNCGDGLLDVSGEACDDGGESASCDANCTAAACGDWTVNAALGETCDDGNHSDGDGCSSACVCADTTDADADGIGDACDDCVNTPSSGKAVVVLKDTGLDPVAGGEALALKITFSLGSGLGFADLDPGSNGLEFSLEAADGRPLETISIPGGAFDGSRGWKQRATQWVYTDNTRPALVNGTSKAVVQDRSSEGSGAVRVQLRAKAANLSVLPYDLPLRVLIRPGLASAAGACDQRGFGREDCRVSSKGNKIRCKL